MPNNAIGVQILGDPSSLLRAFKKSETAATQFAGRMSAVNQASRGALAGSGFSKGALLFGSSQFVAASVATAAIVKSVSAASDLNEQITKNNAVFKESADIVQKWSKTTAQSIGVSREAALEAAGTFGNLFSTVGLAPQSAAEMSQSLVQLAADLASFNNADISDVLLAIRSGLVGEAEPLRKFGVLLSETRVQQEALAETGKKSVKSLTDQEKALARYHIILRDTVPAQGDFARTSEGLANQTRTLKANLDDLAAGLGGVLIPRVVALTGAANDGAAALKKLQDAAPGGSGRRATSFLLTSLPEQVEQQVSNLRRMSEDIDLILQGKGFEKRPSSHLFTDIGKSIADDLGGMVSEINSALPAVFKIAGAVQGAIDGLSGALNSASKKLQRTEAQKAQKAFTVHIKGLGLKLDKAELTASLDDDLAVLREIESSIQRRIAVEGKTFALVQQLTDVRAQIAQVTADKVSAAQSASQDAYDKIIDGLSLKLEIAQATRGFNDDMAALKAIESQILARIAEEGKTTDLARQLFENRQQQADVARQARNATQFEKLGLTSTGDQKTPSANALLKRVGNVENLIKGTVLDTPKTRQKLKNIAAVLSGAFGAVGKDVRDAALQMINDITGALDDKGKISGQLTKTTSLNTNKFLSGLNLTPEQERILRARSSNFNSAGQGLANAQAVGSSGGQFVVESHTTVNLDGQKVASNTTRHQQKTKRRNPRQKRGPNRGD